MDSPHHHVGAACRRRVADRERLALRKCGAEQRERLAARRVVGQDCRAPRTRVRRPRARVLRPLHAARELVQHLDHAAARVAVAVVRAARAAAHHSARLRPRQRVGLAARRALWRRGEGLLDGRPVEGAADRVRVARQPNDRLAILAEIAHQDRVGGALVPLARPEHAPAQHRRQIERRRVPALEGLDEHRRRARGGPAAASAASAFHLCAGRGHPQR
mmetsp:Transcript_42743/g.137783  ORF Transcript_42743/g.137783 Transcript_42743/m.137783 type:complete len:218 (-) Transcript_42743:294-947(-)